MKTLTTTLLVATAFTSLAGLAPAFAHDKTPPPEVKVTQPRYSTAELDSILAPIALHPDSVLTHIFIASTYPLEVVEADRWRQDNLHLEGDRLQRKLERKDWDPSIKALLPFSDLLHNLAEDLDWLAALGDNVIANESRVLGRIQVLRQHAMEAGNLKDSRYLDVDYDDDVIVIEPRRREVVYIPYYDPVVAYGHWWHHAYRPVVWHHRTHYNWHAGFYWGPSVHLATHFYFGGIHWHNRHVVITHRPVKRYYNGYWKTRVNHHHYRHWRSHSKYKNRTYVRSVSYHKPSVQTRAVTHRQGKKHITVHRSHEKKYVANPVTQRPKASNVKHYKGSAQKPVHKANKTKAHKSGHKPHRPANRQHTSKPVKNRVVRHER